MNLHEVLTSSRKWWSNYDTCNASEGCHRISQNGSHNDCFRRTVEANFFCECHTECKATEENKYRRHYMTSEEWYENGNGKCTDCNARNHPTPPVRY